MREYEFDPIGELPIVHAVLKEPLGQKNLALVLDTGYALTQRDHEVLAAIGCGKDNSVSTISISFVAPRSLTA